MKITGLQLTSQFQDENTYDVDTITVDGNNRREIMKAIKDLLTKDGFVMYGKKHKWVALDSLIKKIK